MRRLKLTLPLLAAVVAAFLIGCGGTTPISSRSAPQPAITPLPAQSICRPGSMGAALRCSSKLGALLQLQSGPEPGQTGIDLSNNDPSFGSWRTIRRHASFAYFKVSEGTGFIDGTASQMAREAKAAGLLIGGYDFQHVCGVNPFSEADVFILAAKHVGLLKGSGVLPPTADFEAGGGCNAKVWLGQWSRTVRRVTRDMVYSDPGFYNPSVGCFSEADYGWVADLGAFAPLCGLRTIFHQYSFAAWDGVAHVDGDVFRGSYRQLAALAASAPVETNTQKRARWKRELDAHYRLRAELHAFIDKHHCRRGRPWFGHAKPRNFHTRCGKALAAGKRQNHEINAFHAKRVF